jgi:hypothetical protein
LAALRWLLLLALAAPAGLIQLPPEVTGKTQALVLCQPPSAAAAAVAETTTHLVLQQMVLAAVLAVEVRSHHLLVALVHLVKVTKAQPFLACLTAVAEGVRVLRLWTVVLRLGHTLMVVLD